MERGTDWITLDGIDGEAAIEWGPPEGPQLHGMVQRWHGKERRMPDGQVWSRRFLITVNTREAGIREVNIYEPQQRVRVVTDTGMVMSASLVGEPLATFAAPTSVSDLTAVLRAMVEALDT